MIYSSIKNKLVIYFTLLLLVITMSFSIYNYNSINKSYIYNLISTTKTLITPIHEEALKDVPETVNKLDLFIKTIFLVKADTFFEDAKRNVYLLEFIPLKNIVFYDKNNEIIASMNDYINKIKFEAPSTGIDFYKTKDTVSIKIPFVYKDKIPVTTVVTYYTKELNNKKQSILINATLFSLFFLILGISLTIIISNTIIGPIETLEQKAKEISNGNLDIDINISSDDELGRLSTMFNQMKNSIKNQINDIKKTKIYLKNIIDSINVAIISTDDNLVITNINKTAQKYCNDNFVISHNLISSIEFLKKHEHLIEESIKKNEEKIISRVILEDKLLNIFIYPLKQENEAGSVICIYDITETNNLEQIVLHTEKMRSIGRLTTGVAHEINNPLTSIIQASQNIQRRVSNTLEKNNEIAKKHGFTIENLQGYLKERLITKFVDDILQSAFRASEIISNMLSFSYKNKTSKNYYEINDIIENSIRLASHYYNSKKDIDFKRIETIFDKRKCDGKIYGVKTEIEQVLLNVLKNGSEAMLDKLQAGTTKNYTPMFKLWCDCTKDKLIVYIKDNGPGIPQMMINRIFEPFFTTKEIGKGTGLGLYICYLIIEHNHKGKIRIEKTDKDGTIFAIYLPKQIDGET